MPRACHCGHAGDAGAAFDPAKHCRPCWRWENDPAYRAALGDRPAGAARLAHEVACDAADAARRAGPGGLASFADYDSPEVRATADAIARRHGWMLERRAGPLAEFRLPGRADCAQLGAVVPGQTCGCAQKLRRCRKYGECTAGAPRPGVRCCLTCVDWEPAADPPEPLAGARAYVVTVAGRERYLDATLGSLARSDWGEAPAVVVQPPDEPLGWANTARNYLRTLRQAHADGCEYALVLEDDIEVNRHLRHNLAAWPVLWAGVLDFGSLYVPDLVRSPFEGEGSFVRGSVRLLRHFRGGYPRENIWGSQAYVFSRRMVGWLVEDWGRYQGGQDRRTLYAAAGRGAANYVHGPCLVQHEGAPSGFGTPPHRACDYSADWRAP